MDGAYQCTKKLFADLNPLPTAIFAYSDMIAVGVMKTIHENRLKIPMISPWLDTTISITRNSCEPSLDNRRLICLEIGRKGWKSSQKKIYPSEGRALGRETVIIHPGNHHQGIERWTKKSKERSQAWKIPKSESL